MCASKITANNTMPSRNPQPTVDIHAENSVPRDYQTLITWFQSVSSSCRKDPD